VDAGAGQILVRGSRLLLRALRPGEIDEQWQAMVNSDPIAIARLPDEASFKARLRRSGHMADGWLDLAIDLDGAVIGRIQTFVPEGRRLPAGTFDVGIGLDETVRGKGYGREALALFTGWLFEHAAAQVVQAPTDPGNAPMRAVFGHVGWSLAGSVTEQGREWVMYRITRQEWQAR
jgi:RimJ/RimL family protein N-acetyltransferase